MIVGNFTTPAQYFHALRRQKLNSVRKPLVVMTPKSLLTHAKAVSQVDEFTGETSFQEVIPDAAFDKKEGDVKNVIFCSGKVYYDLLAYRDENQIKDAALVRMEQLYPFHQEKVKEVLARYKNAATYVWCQEEPSNMGAYSFVEPRLRKLIGTDLIYAGRDQASSPATGSKAAHKREQKALCEAAFSA